MKRLMLSVVMAALAACTDPPLAPSVAGGEPLLAKSPDPWGRIVFLSEGELYSMNPDGTALTLLTAGPFGGQEPEWSPKRRQIAFNGADDVTPVWSFDGRIAFASSRTGDLEIFVMNADGSGQANVTLRPAFEDVDPAWSPKGERIAYVSNATGIRSVHVMDAGGANDTSFDGPTGSDDRSPSWSPDGREIVFATLIAGISHDIFRMNADGTGITQLTFNAIDGIQNLSPDWKR